MRRIVIVQRWQESEKGWGTRPDGYSLHLTNEDCLRFIEKYWATMPCATPNEYSRPDGEPYEALVSSSDFDLMMDSGYGRRLHGDPPIPLGKGGEMFGPKLVELPALVCPGGHSETFKTGGGRKTLLAGGYARVNNQGEVIETYDPNTTTSIYTCDVCGVQFERRWRNGKLLPVRVLRVRV